MNSTPAVKISEFRVDNLSECQHLAYKLSRHLKTGDIVTFVGDLGSGKTEFCRALIHACGYNEEVPSPTFNLVQVYEPLPDQPDVPAIWHMDLYRLETPEDIFELGIEDGFDTAITLIEWPDKMGQYLPDGILEITLMAGTEEGQRTITLTGNTYWEKKLKGFTI